MEEFSASLVREKIILVDGDPETKGGAGTSGEAGRTGGAGELAPKGGRS